MFGRGAAGCCHPRPPARTVSGRTTARRLQPLSSACRPPPKRAARGRKLARPSGAAGVPLGVAAAVVCCGGRFPVPVFRFAPPPRPPRDCPAGGGSLGRVTRRKRPARWAARKMKTRARAGGTLRWRADDCPAASWANKRWRECWFTMTGTRLQRGWRRIGERFVPRLRDGARASRGGAASARALGGQEKYRLAGRDTSVQGDHLGCHAARDLRECEL